MRTARFLLPGLILLGATALAVAAPSQADDMSQQIRQLQAEVAKLQQQVAKLEQAQAQYDKAPEQVIRKQPKPGGAQNAYNWGLLLKGMDTSQVRDRLGEPVSTRRISKFELWNYPNGGRVKFYLGRLDRFNPPTAE